MGLRDYIGDPLGLMSLTTNTSRAGLGLECTTALKRKVNSARFQRLRDSSMTIQT